MMRKSRLFFLFFIYSLYPYFFCFVSSCCCFSEENRLVVAASIFPKKKAKFHSLSSLQTQGGYDGQDKKVLVFNARARFYSVVHNTLTSNSSVQHWT